MSTNKLIVNVGGGAYYSLSIVEKLIIKELLNIAKDDV